MLISASYVIFDYVIQPRLLPAREVDAEPPRGVPTYRIVIEIEYNDRTLSELQVWATRLLGKPLIRPSLEFPFPHEGGCLCAYIREDGPPIPAAWSGSNPSITVPGEDVFWMAPAPAMDPLPDLVIDLWRIYYKVASCRN
ncbi:hypothetical protein DYB35_011753 [Aphanomyces astaci]|uniref:Uncharacterized protein n=1 Tax=Aphanomyces astaci TaxID=112090 RepID=A0A418DUE9_APHAT|nr:hypothetical protein DYB35_011753 [Aphanomyces astaci]